MEVWLAPTGTAPSMIVLEGQGAYEVSLFRALTGGDYDVRLRVNLLPPDGRGDPAWVAYETEGAPVKATGRWVHLRVAFDGQAPAVRGGHPRAQRAQSGAPGAAAPAAHGAGAPPRARRIAVPPDGGVTLRVGSSTQPYQGRMDGLVFRGVFRLRDDVVTLPAGLAFEVLQPAKHAAALPRALRQRPARHRPGTRRTWSCCVRDTVRVDDLPLVLELGRSAARCAPTSARRPRPRPPAERGRRDDAPLAHVLARAPDRAPLAAARAHAAAASRCSSC